ncbi:MAG: DUF6056 family protein [Lachnospiraceae bacterium]|nr:DUF6056 family protein [Lachnospiraceae bacterium]
MQDKKKSQKLYIITAAGVAILLILQFVLHLMTPFMRDDLWYATNLVTGEKISSIGDIIESQVWHYFNWGGRSINHALLQAVLASGETGAAILNTLATLILGFAICFAAKVKNPLFYLLAEACIIAFNASIFFSMFWESGSVNYLYSSSWILFYMAIVLKTLDSDFLISTVQSGNNHSSNNSDNGIKNNNPYESKAADDNSSSKKTNIPEILKCIWIIPLSLIAGWSTENMGPSCFVLTVFAIVFLLMKKKKVPFFLFEGALFTLLGSVLMILAPGNFVRNQFVEKTDLVTLINSRIDSFLLSNCEFLFPTFFFAIIILCIQIFVYKNIKIRDMALFMFAVMAECAMMLSPAYPQRASFGIMCVLIAYIISALNKILSDETKYSNLVCVIGSSSMFIYAVTKILTDILYRPY